MWGSRMKKKIELIYPVLVILCLAMLVAIGVTFENQIYYLEMQQDAQEFTDIEANRLDDFSIRIKGKLPSGLRDGTVLAFYTVHQNVSLTLEGETVYTLVDGENAFGSTPGIEWNFVRLDKKSAGKMVNILLRSPYRESASWIPEFYIGASLSVYHMIMHKYMVSTIICVAMIAIGLMLIAYWIVMHKRADMDGNLVFLGIFSLFLGIWSLNELPVMPLLLNNHPVTAYISYVMLMLMIVPFIMFERNLFKDRDHFMWYVIMGISYLDIIVCTSLQLLDLVDFRKTLVLTHITLVSFTLVSLGMIVREIRKDGVTRKLKINAGFLMLNLFGLTVDLILYYCRIGDSNIFGRLCFLIYIIVLGIMGTVNAQNLIKQGQEAAIYHKLAYLDQLTGFFNRTAFARDMRDFEGENIRKMQVFVLDLNNLKYTNDNFGHKSGDRYIITAAEMIRQVFGKYGKCYRIGGDEFCVVTTGITKERREELLKALSKKAYESSRKSGALQIGIACGFSEYTDNDSMPDEIVSRADHSMYRNKASMKSENKPENKSEKHR